MNIIYGGDEAFGALAFGLQNPANRQFFDNQLQHAISTVGNAFGEYGQRFVDNAKRMHESFNNSRVMELARAALNQVSGIFIMHRLKPQASKSFLISANGAEEKTKIFGELQEKKNLKILTQTKVMMVLKKTPLN